MASTTYDDLIQRRRDAGLELLPVGTYDTVVIDAEKPQKGAAMGFVVQFEVTSGPLAGRRFKNWMTLSEAVIAEWPGLIDAWFREMAALGFTDDYFAAEPDDKTVIAALKGRTASVQVGRRVKKNSGDEVADYKVFPPATPQPAVPAPAPNPFAQSAPPVASAPPAAVAPTGPAADPNAPGMPPF